MVPIGTLVVLTVIGATTMLNRLLATRLIGLAESMILTVNDRVPGVVGVPVILPVAESLRPAGNRPEDTFQAYGPLPPFGVRAFA